ncbi:MAG: hypothetical protein CMJ27_01565 [Phycisphaerae bacterium]|nr:hypothetical protein [Phycisphaerae bacterium]OUX03153.1 MAG: hypothetical protein CBD91_01005 [Phycisphaeraceae bacterium TMED231]
MGNAIWIFIGIAIIQAIVGGIAKSAEKRKKAEAAQRMLEASREGGGSAAATDAATSAPTRMAVADDTRGRSNRSAQRRLEELRKKRLEVLRRRAGPDAGVTAAVDPNPRRTNATVAKPPPIAAPISAPMRATPPIPSTPARVAAVQETRPSTPATRAPQPIRREPRTAASGRQSTRQAAQDAAHKSAHKSAHEAGHASGSYGSNRTRSGSSAKRLRGLLRTPTGFREALLLGELLKPPVGLRSPQGETE